MSQLQLHMCARDKQIYNGKADYLLLPGWEGEIGLYGGHEPLIGVLKPGRLVLRIEDHEAEMIVGEGFFSVEENDVVVAVAFVDEIEDLHEDLLLKELDEAKKALAEANSYRDTDDIYIRYMRARARLHAAQRFNEK